MPEVLSEPRRHFLWNALLSCVNLTNGFSHLLGGHTLEYVRARTCRQSPLDFDVAIKSSQHDDTCLWKLFSNCDHGVDPAHTWKPEVHQSNVGLVFTKIRDRFVSVGGLRHHLHVRLAIDHAGNPLAHERMVIDSENSDWVLHDYPHCLEASVRQAR